MRTTLLLVSVLPLFAAALNDYFANDPIWRVNSICNDGGGIGGFCISDKTYNYFIGGDSTTNGYVYKKVMQQGVQTLYWQGGNPPPPPICTGTTTFGPTQVAMLRQDGLKIYDWQEDMEVLVHDFDLSLGDTVPLTGTNWNSDITVSAIDSIQVGNEWRKRFALTNSWAPYMVEGIGSSHGLLEPLSNFFDCGYELECYGLGTVGYYPAPGPDCAMVMGMNELSVAGASLSCFPNPATDRLTITSDRPLGTIKLFDAQGREVVSSVSKASSMELDLGEARNGLYTATVSGAQARIVVQR